MTKQFIFTFSVKCTVIIIFNITVCNKTKLGPLMCDSMSKKSFQVVNVTIFS